jgi:hypothetical protein
MLWNPWLDVSLFVSHVFTFFTNENIIIIGKVNVDVVISKEVAWGFGSKFW